jgi:hypothetical protein
MNYYRKWIQTAVLTAIEMKSSSYNFFEQYKTHLMIKIYEIGKKNAQCLASMKHRPSFSHHSLLVRNNVNSD